MKLLSINTQTRDKTGKVLNFKWQFTMGRTTQALGAKGFETQHNFLPGVGVYMGSIGSTRSAQRQRMYDDARRILRIVDRAYARNDDFVVQFSSMGNSRDHHVGMHTDDKDISQQYALQLGSCLDGGGLLRTGDNQTCPIVDTNYRHKVIRFDGRLPHAVVGDFEGERLNVIFYKMYDRHLRKAQPIMSGITVVADLRDLMAIHPSCNTRSGQSQDSTKPFISIIAVAGASCSGKSSVMRYVTGFLTRAFQPSSCWNRGPLHGTLYGRGQILVVGVGYDELEVCHTPGTDQFSCTAGPALLHMLQDPPPGVGVICLEGNSMKSLTKAVVRHTVESDGTIIFLDVECTILSNRQRERDLLTENQRSGRWLKSDCTRATNIAAEAAGACCRERNNNMADMRRIGNRVCKMIRTGVGAREVEVPQTL
jgi:hypothetical protein